MAYLRDLRIDSDGAKFNIKLEEHLNALNGAYHSDVLVHSNTALPTVVRAGRSGETDSKVGLV